MTDNTQPQATNKYRNNLKAFDYGNQFWDESERNGLAGIVANLVGDGSLETADGHRFINVSCCSYLDLDSHPSIVQGAIDALHRYGVLDHCISRIRIQIRRCWSWRRRSRSCSRPRSSPPFPPVRPRQASSRCWRPGT